VEFYEELVVSFFHSNFISDMKSRKKLLFSMRNDVNKTGINVGITDVNYL
jgi:hypothetical protein